MQLICYVYIIMTRIAIVLIYPVLLCLNSSSFTVQVSIAIVLIYPVLLCCMYGSNY